MKPIVTPVFNDFQLELIATGLCCYIREINQVYDELPESERRFKGTDIILQEINSILKTLDVLSDSDDVQPLES